MSIAIAFGDIEDENSVSGAIYFSAVTSYNRKYVSKVSEHPLEMGVSVTDHYISANPVYTVSGVVSSVDFSSIPSVAIIEGSEIINNDAPPSVVSVNSGGSSLMSLIPASVSQFIPSSISVDVSMDDNERENRRDEIEELLKELMSGVYYNEKEGKWENRMSPITMYMMEGIIPSNPIENLVLTDLTVMEDENTGEEFTANFTFEQVRFVTLEDTDAPNPPAPSTTANKTAPNSNKGNQSSSEIDDFNIEDSGNTSTGAADLFSQSPPVPT